MWLASWCCRFLAHQFGSSSDQTIPLFTREGTLACPTLDAFHVAYNAMTHGWRYVPTAGIFKLALPGQPVTPQAFGCAIYHDGVAVQITRKTFSEAETNIGWVSQINLRTAPINAALGDKPIRGNTGMVLGSSIGNDPAKEKLCASRARGKSVPFEIDSRYVAAARSQHPDVTFVAIDGISPQLVECFLRPGTGKYEPDSLSPEQNFWHLMKPKGSGIAAQKDRSTAIKTCLDAAIAKSNRTGLDHSVSNAIFEVDLNRAGT